VALRIEGVSAGAIILMVISCVVAAIGLVSLSQATAGVGGISIAVLLAVFARIAQASAHHKAVLRTLQPR
jgi:hypothetical protein